MTIPLRESIDQSTDNSTAGCTGIVCLGQVGLRKKLRKAFCFSELRLEVALMNFSFGCDQWLPSPWLWESKPAHSSLCQSLDFDFHCCFPHCPSLISHSSYCAQLLPEHAQSPGRSTQLTSYPQLHQQPTQQQKPHSMANQRERKHYDGTKWRVEIYCQAPLALYKNEFFLK